MIKPITKRERLLMKKAFDAARFVYAEGEVYIHGNFKDFLFKNKYIVK